MFAVAVVDGIDLAQTCTHAQVINFTTPCGRMGGVKHPADKSDLQGKRTLVWTNK
jgi:hypothetical protein